MAGGTASRYPACPCCPGRCCIKGGEAVDRPSQAPAAPQPPDSPIRARTALSSGHPRRSRLPCKVHPRTGSRSSGRNPSSHRVHGRTRTPVLIAIRAAGPPGRFRGRQARALGFPPPRRKQERLDRQPGFCGVWTLSVPWRRIGWGRPVSCDQTSTNGPCGRPFGPINILCLSCWWGRYMMCVRGVVDEWQLPCRLRRSSSAMVP